jgi:hypothetical protein
MFNVFNFLKIGVELDDELPSSSIGARVEPKQVASKWSRFLCLCVYITLVCATTPLVWMHSSYLSNFEFNEEWQGCYTSLHALGTFFLSLRLRVKVGQVLKVSILNFFEKSSSIANFLVRWLILMYCKTQCLHNFQF